MEGTDVTGRESSVPQRAGGTIRARSSNKLAPVEDEATPMSGSDEPIVEVRDLRPWRRQPLNGVIKYFIVIGISCIRFTITTPILDSTHHPLYCRHLPLSRSPPRVDAEGPRAMCRIIYKISAILIDAFELEREDFPGICARPLPFRAGEIAINVYGSEVSALNQHVSL